MKLGRVGFISSYVVDLDDDVMVDRAIDCLYEDITNAVKNNELEYSIGVLPNNVDPVDLSEEDIPEFLKGEEEC